MEQSWIGEHEPEGTATIPEGMPPAGFKPGMAYNRAGRWLEQRGWYSLHSLAKLLNVKRLSLKRRCLKGQFPYLRVSARSWWVPPTAIAKIFETYGDPPAYRAWVAAKRPLRGTRQH